MGQVLIRNLDDRVIDSLKLKAELSGKSLEQLLRELVTANAPLSPEERVALGRRIRAMTPGVQQTDSAALLREDRDAR